MREAAPRVRASLMAKEPIHTSCRARRAPPAHSGGSDGQSSAKSCRRICCAGCAQEPGGLRAVPQPVRRANPPKNSTASGAGDPQAVRFTEILSTVSRRLDSM